MRIGDDWYLKKNHANTYMFCNMLVSLWRFAYWVILHAFLSSADFSFKINFFEKNPLSAKQYGSRWGFVGSYLDPSCLQSLSADGTSWLELNQTKLLDTFWIMDSCSYFNPLPNVNLDICTQWSWNVAQYPLLHVTYAPAKFEVATFNGCTIYYSWIPLSIHNKPA